MSVPVFQDPVCGVYLSEAESQIEIFSGKRYYFCSARCRDEFRKRTEK
ncbi:MAG TPA: YHS domain-containing protein [Deltaproteobacteria bacterium]|nr:YHS domain-containing protein [Deltaproteobacteria bacterium]HQB38660.1 YHS domain-containing protein [Deltaproteobacteria bacterium]